MSRKKKSVIDNALARPQRGDRIQVGPAAARLLTAANGTRLSLCAYRDRRLEIWTQQHQDDGCKSGDGDEEWKAH
jgi:hypothetical protein